MQVCERGGRGGRVSDEIRGAEGRARAARGEGEECSDAKAIGHSIIHAPKSYN